MTQAELPSENINIRMQWVKAIGDCRKAFSDFQLTRMKLDEDFGATVSFCINNVDALISILADYGEATVLSDVNQWKKEHYIPSHNETWEKYYIAKKELEERGDYKETTETIFAHMESMGSISLREIRKNCWNNDYNLVAELFEYIVQTINKYGMLFQEQPRGYSNVEMKAL